MTTVLECQINKLIKSHLFRPRNNFFSSEPKLISSARKLFKAIKGEELLVNEEIFSGRQEIDRKNLILLLASFKLLQTFFTFLKAEVFTNRLTKAPGLEENSHVARSKAIVLTDLILVLIPEMIFAASFSPGKKFKILEFYNQMVSRGLLINLTRVERKKKLFTRRSLQTFLEEQASKLKVLAKH